MALSVGTIMLSGAWAKVGEQTLTAPTTSINFPSLSGYTRYMIKIDGQVDNAGDFLVMINSDGGAKYQYETVSGIVAAAAAAATVNGTSWKFGSATVGSYFSAELVISKSPVGISTYIGNCMCNGTRMFFTGGYFNDAGAITRFDISMSMNNWHTGTKFTLYGAI